MEVKSIIFVHSFLKLAMLFRDYLLFKRSLIAVNVQCFDSVYIICEMRIICIVRIR